MSADEETSPQGLRIANLHASLRPSARDLVPELDENGDGVIDNEEMAKALNLLKDSRNKNRSLIRVVGGLVGSGFLLAGGVFGTSIAAARLSKDTVVDSQGILHAKGTGSVVKTSQALKWASDRKLADFSNAELMGLEHISLMDGNLHFQVKGFARPPSEDDKVVLLVEGGTVTYDEGGVADATGDALALVNAARGADGNAQRKLRGNPEDFGKIVDLGEEYGNPEDFGKIVDLGEEYGFIELTPTETCICIVLDDCECEN